MLVTAGARAAHMGCLRYIALPSGSIGKDKLAKFISKVVDEYLNKDIDISFDEFMYDITIYKNPNGDTSLKLLKSN